MPAKPRAPATPNREQARALLEAEWDAILIDDTAETTEAIDRLINSNQTSIRFCLPTQLLGKLINPGLDILCMQKGDGTNGRWDPRGFAVDVIVPWNQANQHVLGRSADPYVSNPLRRPRVDHGLDQLSDRNQWEALCDLLTEIQSKADHEVTYRVWRSVLVSIRNRLRELTFVYAVPQTITASQAESLIRNFLASGSGGDRGLSVAAAFFQTIGNTFKIYDSLRRGVINATDLASKAAADLECIGPDGELILAVEVKERLIDESDIRVAIDKARSSSVKEYLLCTRGVEPAEQAAVDRKIASAWASGTNLYHATIFDLMRGCLPILGEAGIRDFIIQIGKQLDQFTTQPRHRKAWKTLLDSL